MNHLPPNIDLETKAVLKKAASARAALGEMKGVAKSIPNDSILITTLSLQEAKDSSEIENIVTTHDEIYRAGSAIDDTVSVAAKEVHRYVQALNEGWLNIMKVGLLLNKDIIEVQRILENNDAGFRKQPGTELKNDQTGEVVYVPPQHHDQIVDLMKDLERFMHVPEISDWGPLVKMAVIHHQFESIHPFYDGNGRTGRIVNILYLVKEELLDMPILYLSRYINRHKGDYYRLLQAVRDENAWEEWVLFILDAVEQTAINTTALIKDIKQLMLEHKKELRTSLPKIYSQDLLNNIFRHPYTKIHFIMDDLNVSRPTATRYLEELVTLGILKKEEVGRENYYINIELFKLLERVGGR